MASYYEYVDDPHRDYDQFQGQAHGTSGAPYGPADNVYGPNKYAASLLYDYGGPPPPIYQPPLPNMVGQQMQLYGQYQNPQLGPNYGPAHDASYAAPARRASMSINPLNPDIGTAPIAVAHFAIRDDFGAPVPSMFQISAKHDTGVVHITHNPFNIRINEVLVLLGQECVIAEYPPSSGIYAVHIIQDRMTGKTNDVFVELKDWSEAERVIRRYNAQANRDRAPKLGNRRAKIDLATHTQMMKAMFPRAKCTWVNGQPERAEAWLRDHQSQWDGFITNEELVKVLLFAEQPRSSKTRFAQDSPERVYQFMISSIQKMPWDADRSYFPRKWIGELHHVLSRMALRLANLVKDREHFTLDSKLLEHFMKVLKSSPMYGNGDSRAMENYMSIAEAVDNVMSRATNVIAPPLAQRDRRGTNSSNNNNGYSYRPSARVRDEGSLVKGLRGMHLVNRNHSPVRARSPSKSHPTVTSRRRTTSASPIESQGSSGGCSAPAHFNNVN